MAGWASPHGAGHDCLDVPRQRAAGASGNHRPQLSCHDLIDILPHKWPSKIKTDDDMAIMIEERHRRRRVAMQSSYQKQAVTLAASN